MLRSMFRSSEPVDVRDHFVIAPHHPDRLRRPAARLGALAEDRFAQSLTWNVFRTFELLPPAFWLRRFHARAAGTAFSAAPQVVRISLWETLSLPPVRRLEGDRAGAAVDVVIETEHAVWTLIVATDRDSWLGDDPGIADVVDAGSWLAGAREHYCGVIDRAAGGVSLGTVLRDRYSRSRDSAALRSQTRGPAQPTRVVWGAVRWDDLAAILAECAAASHLLPIEQALARHALTWLKQAGIDAGGPSSG
jgi:hypothetical protein